MIIRPDEYIDGVAAAQAGDFERATALLTTAAERIPNDARTWLWLAACAQRATVAITHLRRVLEIEPNHDVAGEALATLLVAQSTDLKSSDPEAACAALAEACDLVPFDHKTWLLLREVCSDETRRLGFTRRAVAAFPHSEDLKSGLRDDLVRCAITAGREDRPDAAREMLREASEVAPTDIRVLLALAHVSHAADAVEVLEKALALEPDHPAATVALTERSIDAGILAFQQGNATRADELLRRAIKLAPNNVRAWKVLVEQASTTAWRIECLRRVIALEPGPGEAVTTLGRLLLDEATARAAAEDRAEARKLYREVVTLDPGSVQGWWGLASQAAVDTEALEAAARVLALDPGHADARALQRRLTPPAAPDPDTTPASASAAAPARSAALAGAGGSGRSIMVIDDSPTIRKALTIILEREGHQVMTEPDGETALASLAMTRPDLVFLDITMPKMDGYEVCRQIRKRGDLANLPVVMLSGKDGFFDKVRGRMAGATEYITKPFEPPAVLAAIAEHCAR